MFLTPEQLEELTGLVQYAAQRRWLRRQGIRFRQRADGRPVVMVSDLSQTDPAVASKRDGPRFDLIAG